jgi:hypothetical protein
MVILHFRFWPQEAKKNQKEFQEAFMRAINSAFWMELNMTLNILAFCISSLQNNCHFVFWILWELRPCLVSVGKNFVTL